MSLGADFLAAARQGDGEYVLNYVLSFTHHNYVMDRAVSLFVVEVNGQLLASAEAPDGSFLVPSLRRELADQVLAWFRCRECGAQLVEGEQRICTLCEAAQVAAARRIYRDLLDKGQRSV